MIEFPAFLLGLTAIVGSVLVAGYYSEDQYKRDLVKQELLRIFEGNKVLFSIISESMYDSMMQDRRQEGKKYLISINFRRKKRKC